jgi:hypothetical protein
MGKTHLKSTCKRHTSVISRILCGCTIPCLQNKKAKTNQMSKNARTEIQTKYKNKVKMGIEVPRNTREALLFNKQNKNTLWADAILKEMSGLRRLKVFKFHAPNYRCNKKEGWQLAPMHMFFGDT